MVPVQEQRSRVLILANSCVHILYGVSSMILISYAMKYVSHETHADNGILKNWDAKMIVDIQSSRYDSCPAGYDPMISYEWPGTISACNCLLWDDNPTSPHGPDGEYTQIPMNNNNLKLSKHKKNSQFNSTTAKSSEEMKQNSFVKTKLENLQNNNEQVSLDDEDNEQDHDIFQNDNNEQINSETLQNSSSNQQDQLDEQNTNKKGDQKKEIKHKSSNKSQSSKQQNFQNGQQMYTNTNQNRRETKEDVMNKLSKYGLENKIYKDGVCNWNQTEAGCLDIQPNKPMQFSKWKQRLQWCVQRAQAVSMTTMYHYYDPVKGECTNENLRVCGDPDDKNFQYCFPKTYPACPINGIFITTTPPRGQESYYYNSRPMQFSRNQMLYVSRTIPKSLPISGFTVSEDSVCINDSNPNISENHDEYFLLKKQRNRCINETDSRFELIDQQGEHSYYFNNFALNFRDTLPKFSLNNTYQYGLYKENYIQWKHECAENMGYFLSDNVFDQFFTREKTLKIITYLVAILTIIVAVIELLLICKIPFILNIEKGLLQYNPCIQIALSLIVLPFCAAALYQSRVFTNLESMLQSQQCSDEFTLKLISKGSVEVHQKIQNFNKGQIIFICFVLLVNAVNFLLTLCCANSSQATAKKKRRASTY